MGAKKSSRNRWLEIKFKRNLKKIILSKYPLKIHEKVLNSKTLRNTWDKKKVLRLMKIILLNYQLNPNKKSFTIF